MVSFVDGYRSAIRSAMCQYIKNGEQGASFLKRFFPTLPFVDASPVKAIVCDDPVPNEPPPSKFNGGQCVGRQYTLQWSFEGLGFPVAEVTAFGPINDMNAVFTGAFQNGNKVYSLSWNAGDPGVNFGFGDRTDQGADTSPTYLVFPTDGQPDTCGDLPPDIPDFPPEGVDVPISINFDNDVNVNTTLNGTLHIWAPVITGIFKPTLNVRVPVRLELPDFNLRGDVIIAPEFDVDLFPDFGDDSPGIPDPPGEPADGPSGTSEPDTSPTTPEDDSKSELIGLFVRSTFDAEITRSQIFATEGPDLFVPRLASVHFRVRQAGRLGWLGPIDVKNTNTYIPVPPGVYAVSWSVHEEQNVTTAVTPVYQDVDE